MNNKLGRFGILTCKLIDPLSNIIDIISANNKYNTIGVYYIKNDDYYVMLFNVYDGYNIHYIKTINEIISSRYVSKLTYFSLDDKSNNNFQSLCNLNYLKTPVLDLIKSQLEEKFINIINGLSIIYNINTTSRNYDNLLLNIINKKKNGRTIIYKILSLLDNTINVKFTKSPLIKNTVVININKSYTYINTDLNLDNLNIEISKLYQCFIIYHDKFPKIDHSIFINDNKINIANNNNNDNIIILGKCLADVINCDNKVDQTLHFKNMIIMYNNIVKNYNIPLIENKINILLYPEIILPQSSTTEIITIISSNIKSKNNTNLNILSNNQLFDILIYIDSLRDSLGSTDNKFSGIKNIITKELALRKNIK